MPDPGKNRRSPSVSAGPPASGPAGAPEISGSIQHQDLLRHHADLLDQVRDGIVVCDMNDRVAYWNRGAERIYGWPPGKTTGRDAVELLFPDAPHMFHQAKKQLLERGEWKGEVKQKARDGSLLTIETRWSLLLDPEGSPFGNLMINTDITEKKEIEHQLHRSQRLESIGTLAGGIAHDLNNVLVPVLMGIQMLKEEVSEESQHIVDTVKSSTERGISIVQQILSFARGKPGDRARMQLQHLVAEQVKIVRETFPCSISIETALENDLWPIHGDATRLHQVLMNLCLNARDAMPKGGNLHITAKNIFLEESNLREQPEARPGAYVQVAISDTGCGIAPENIDRIFDPFFSTKETGQGTGLGLSTMAGIVRSHGGFWEVQSEPGAGATFRVFLPAADAPAKGLSRPEEPKALQGDGQLILVADDDPPVLAITQKVLEKSGYRVITATNGREAVERFRENPAGFDLAIMDMSMPVMDGPAAIRSIRKIRKDFPIVPVSGLENRKGDADAASQEQTLFLGKPYSTERLLAAVRKAMNNASSTGA